MQTKEHEILETIDSTEEKPAFVIDDESKANWVLGKIAAIREEKARIQAQTAKRLEELDTDEKDLLRRFESQLQAWALTESERRRRQTVTLTNGTLAFRKQPARPVISDELQAIEGAKVALPSAVLTVEKLDRKALLDYCKETGEALEGVAYQPETLAFSIRLPKDAGEPG